MKNITLDHLQSLCDDIGGHWIWRGRVSDTGTPRFCAFGRDQSVYRLAYCLHHGVSLESINGLYVWPKTERLDINPEALIIGTIAEQRSWEKENGRARRNLAARASLTNGARARKTTKLNAELAREIRASDETKEELAKRLGVCVSAIRDVRNGRTWKQTVARSSVFSLGAA